MLIHDKEHCFYCHTRLTPVIHGISRLPTEISKEHIIPSSKGGNNGPDNIIYACWKCNSARANKDLEEWFKDQTDQIMFDSIWTLIQYKNKMGNKLYKPKKHYEKKFESCPAFRDHMLLKHTDRFMQIDIENLEWLYYNFIHKK
jgi:hypothetical protein